MASAADCGAVGERSTAARQPDRSLNLDYSEQDLAQRSGCLRTNQERHQPQDTVVIKDFNSRTAVITGAGSGI
jgi:hypothetical protein